MLGLFFASFFTGWIYMIPAIGVAVVLYGLSSYIKDNGLVFAAVFFIPIVIEYINTGFVGRFPTLFVCGFVELAAIQSFFAGLILENISQKDRKDFEMTLLSISQHTNH